MYTSLGSCLVEKFNATSKFIITFIYAASNGFGFAIYFAFTKTAGNRINYCA